jgi:hypothetical protein
VNSCTGRGVRPPQPYLKEWDEQIVRLQAENRQLLDTLRTVLSSLEHLGMDAFADAPFLIRAVRAAIGKASGSASHG